MKKIEAYLIYLAVVSAMNLAGILRYSFLKKIGQAAGFILYHIPMFGKLCRVNIHAAFPEKDDREVRRIARESLNNLVLTLLEFFWVRKHPDEFRSLLDLTEADKTAETGRKASESGQGAILVTPHLGNWEFSGRILAQIYHYKMATVVRTARNPYLDKIISQGRQAGDVEIIHSKGAAHAMKQALDRGRTVGILIDQNVRVRNGGIFVNMFGIPVPVSRAPATFARTAGRFVAVGTTLRQADGTFKGYLRPLPKPASEYASDEEMIQALTDISAEWIRMAPEQYLWMYKRFQYIPENVPEDVLKRFPKYARHPAKSFYRKTSHDGTGK